MNILWFNLKVDQDDQVLAFNLDWINKMAKKVNKIVVITMEKGQYKLYDNVVVYSIGKEKGYSEFRRFFVFFRLLYKVLREEKIDLVFSHMAILFTAMAGIFLRLKKIPIFQWYCHGTVSLKLRIAVFFSKFVFTCTPIGMNVKTRKKIVIGHGIDIKKFVSAKKNQQDNILLHVGRISPVKNIHVIIEAFGLPILRKNKQNLRFFIIGEPTGSKRDRIYFSCLKRMVLEKKLNGSVSFLGIKSQHELIPFYHRGRLLVNVSDTCGLDKVILESMACGCIPITSNESFKALYGHCFPRLVVSKEPQVIADTIQYFLSNRMQENKNLTKELRCMVEKNHSLDRLIDTLYAEVKKSV